MILREILEWNRKIFFYTPNNAANPEEDKKARTNLKKTGFVLESFLKKEAAALVAYSATFATDNHERISP